jgi:uncharacterized membrane protein YphA (DoxX/SURF4 family)
MDVLFLLSRVVFVVPILIGAYRTYVEDHDGSVRAFRRGSVPMPEVVAPVVGLAVIGGALMVGFGVVPDLGALLLAAGVLGSGVALHPFWRQGSAAGRDRELGLFKRNVVVAAAAMTLFYLFNQLQGKAGFILTDPLFAKDTG